MASLAGKTAFISGGSKGIGFACARALAIAGAEMGGSGIGIISA